MTAPIQRKTIPKSTVADRCVDDVKVRPPRRSSLSWTQLLAVFLGGSFFGSQWTVWHPSTRSNSSHNYSLSSSYTPNPQIRHASSTIDFSGGGKPSKAYRLGDVFCLWFLKWKAFSQLLNDYKTRFPGTLATRYLQACGSTAHCHRNVTALVQVLQASPPPRRTAAPDELIIHLRLGDTLTDPEYTDLSVSIHELWTSPEGFVCLDDHVKYQYHRREFVELLGRLPQDIQFSRCTLVGGRHNTVEEHAHRNVEYQQLVRELLQDVVGCEVDNYQSGHDPDEDFAFLASAHYLVAGMGGYAQMATAAVRWQRGWGHALCDKFNGHIAGYNDDRFSKEQRHLFGREYVDWVSLNGGGDDLSRIYHEHHEHEHHSSSNHKHKHRHKK